MKIIAAIDADLQRGPLGLRSRLNEVIAGETVLRRTLRRVRASKRLASVHLISSIRECGLVRDAAAGIDVAVESSEPVPIPWAEYMATTRKWSLDGWRGGIGNSTVFDEGTNPAVLEALARREGADGVAVVPAAGVLFDAGLLDRMLDYFEEVKADARMVFTQTAPGLSAAVYTASLLADMAAVGQPIGRIMAYRPNDPQKDMVSQSCFHPCDALVMQAYGRCLADTAGGFDRVAAIIGELGDGGDLTAVSQWLTANRFAARGPLPGDVEIEVTTLDSLPDSTLRPRGAAVPARGPMNPMHFGRIIDELGTRDDSRVTLGGFGDPLLHPEWPAMVRRCREAGIFGVAMRTSGVALDDAAIAEVLDTRLDVLHVLLDAATPETYLKLHRADLFERAIGNLDRLFEAQRRIRGTNVTTPLVVCEMSKTRATMDEMERFHDEWISRAGAAMLVGPSAYAGQWPDLGVMNMAPPNRFPCERLFNRAMILADGKLAACDQDFRGLHPVGSLCETSLGALWQGERMKALRRSHFDGAYNGMPLCAACCEWHRP